ncbi:MAG: hypothetical protein B7Y39_18850 [Bdellovibrio sp. 28-41-41]|nr:MAG: hypothetical protein B7Y39_18850 [Bdellovibrio sp. 28-41-41]
MTKSIFQLILILFFAVPGLVHGITSKTAKDAAYIPRGSHASIESSVADYRKMESFLLESIKTDPELKGLAPAVGYAVAEIYLKNQDYQEAIWALDRTGHYSLAEKIASEYENFLKTADIIKIKMLNRGITQSAIVEFKNGQRAILKNADLVNPQSNRFEIWTYEFDRKLGFNLTPTAVLRKIGGVEYAVIAFLEGARSSLINMRERVNPAYPDLYLLDFLTGQWDRHDDNSMFSKNGRLFGIDNGRIAKPQFRPEFDERMIPSDQVLLNVSRFPISELENEFSFVKEKTQVVLSRFGQKSYVGKLRPHSRQARRVIPTMNFQLSLNGQIKKVVKDFKDDILQRSKIRESKTEVGQINGIKATSVNMETLEIYLLKEETMVALIENGNLAEISRLYKIAQSDPSMKVKFFENLFYNFEPFNEELSRMAGDMLSQERSIFSEMQSVVLRAVKVAPYSKIFEKELLSFIETFENRHYMKSNLFSEYVKVKLSHSKDSPAIVNEMLDLMVKWELVDLKRFIPSGLKVRGQTASRLWALYLASETQGYFPIATLEDFIQGMKPGHAQLEEFGKRLGYITQKSTASEVLKLIESSQNKIPLLQAFKKQISQDKSGALAVAYLNNQFAKKPSSDSVLRLFNEIATRVPDGALYSIIQNFESAYPKQAWKPVLLLLTKRKPSDIEHKLSFYNGRKASFEVDEAVLTMDIAALKKYLNPVSSSRKNLSCKGLYGLQ